MTIKGIESVRFNGQRIVYYEQIKHLLPTPTTHHARAFVLLPSEITLPEHSTIVRPKLDLIFLECVSNANVSGVVLRRNRGLHKNEVSVVSERLKSAVARQ